MEGFESFASATIHGIIIKEADVNYLENIDAFLAKVHVGIWNGNFMEQVVVQAFKDGEADIAPLEFRLLAEFAKKGMMVTVQGDIKFNNYNRSRSSIPLPSIHPHKGGMILHQKPAIDVVKLDDFLDKCEEKEGKTGLVKVIKRATNRLEDL